MGVKTKKLIGFIVIVFEKLKQGQCNVDITCMLDSDNGQGDTKISALSMERLSKLGLDLTFDVYADCE